MPALLGDTHGGLNQRRCQQPLVVVLEQQGIGIGQRLLRLRGHPLQLLTAQEAVDFLVDAHHLLAAGQDPRLRGRRAPRRGLDERIGQLERGHLGAQRSPGRIVTHHTYQSAGGSHRRHVGRHVRGTTEGSPVFPDADHRHRRLRGEALRIADQVPVEDEVTDHDDAALRHPLDELQHAVAGNRGWGRAGAHGRSSGAWGCRTPETCVERGERGRGAPRPAGGPPRYL